MHPDATTRYPILARVVILRLAACHRSISVIIFMSCSFSLSLFLSLPRFGFLRFLGSATSPCEPAHAFQYFTLTTSLPDLSHPDSTLFNFQGDNLLGFLRGTTATLNPATGHVFSFCVVGTLPSARTALSLSLPLSLVSVSRSLDNPITFVRPVPSAGRPAAGCKISFDDISTTFRAFDVTGDARSTACEMAQRVHRFSP